MGPPGYQLYKEFPHLLERWVCLSINGRSSGSNTWRYVSTICLAIFSGDIHLHRPYNYSLIYGRYLHFRILKFPLIVFMVPNLSMSSNALVLWVFRCFQILTHLHLFGCCLRFPVLLCWSFPWNCQSHEQWISGSLLTSGRSAILTNVYFATWTTLDRQPKKGKSWLCSPTIAPQTKGMQVYPKVFSQFKFTNVNCI